MSTNLYSVIGGTGYAAGELLRILVNRDDMELHQVVSNSKAGVGISEVHSFLAGFLEQKLVSKLAPITVDHDRHVVFLALPHELSLQAISDNAIDLSDPRVVLVDLAGDFRLHNLEVHRRFYPNAAAEPELRQQFVYGLAELHRQALRGARFIACPGCSATACSLAVLPLAGREPRLKVVFDVKNGTSGAGRKEGSLTHHPLRNSSVTAYKVLEHRHEPEILQNINDPLGERTSTMYVPHLLPFSRGIFVTAYIELEKALSVDSCYALYREYYKESPFVRVRSGQPELSDVVGSNFTDIYLYTRGRQLVVVSMLDNLMKGAAGQAVQNMNLALGFEESRGLMFPSIPWA
jgi:N-acetyl-gamma-glutamyl-phosphate reductase